MTQPVFPSVAVIGVGNMGGGIAANLLARGYSVRIHDIDAAKHDIYVKKGALAQWNVAQAAINSIVIIVCVIDAVQTEQVLFGAHGVASAVSTGHTVMLCPTIAPQDVEHFAARLEERGIHTIDAPMSGGPVRAADGSMSLMVACADAVYDKHADLINHLSSKVFRISQRPGDGARTKLVNNLLAGINLVGAAEALALAQRMGLNLETTQKVIHQSSGQSWIGTDRMQRALQGDYTPRAHMGLLAKDTAMAVEASVQLGEGHTYQGPLGKRASDVFARAMVAGLALEDDCALFKLLQTRVSG